MDFLSQKFNKLNLDLPFEVPFLPKEKTVATDFEHTVFLLMLPDLVLHHIFKYLDSSDLNNFRTVCKHAKFYIDSKYTRRIYFDTVERLGEFLDSKFKTTITKFIFDDLSWIKEDIDSTPPPSRGFASDLMQTLIFKPIANHLIYNYVCANQLFSTFLKRYGPTITHFEVREYHHVNEFNQFDELIAAVSPAKFEYLKMTNLHLKDSPEFAKHARNVSGLKHLSFEQISLPLNRNSHPIFNYEFFFTNCPSLEFIEIPNRVDTEKENTTDEEIINLVYRPIIGYLKRRSLENMDEAAANIDADIQRDLRIAFHPEAHHEFYTIPTLPPIQKTRHVFYELVEHSHRVRGTLHVVPIQLIPDGLGNEVTDIQRVALKMCVKSVRVPESDKWPESTWDSYPNGKILEMERD